jgi:hypothetical protein
MTVIRPPSGLEDASEGPFEYKDTPLRMTFIIEGRREPVRLVEPEMDLSFPDGALLRVEEGDRHLWDVVFHFDGEARQPYRLDMSGTGDAGRRQDLHLAYGSGVAPESDMRAVFRRTILERAHVRVHIEMTHRTARLQIRSHRPERTPPPSP